MSLDTTMDPCRLVPKVQKNDTIMLTLTYETKDQHADCLIEHRLNKFREMFMGKVKPYLDKILHTGYEYCTELSEPLAWDGKQFPRLHNHIVGIIKCPITFLLVMGLYVKRLKMGYHVHILTDGDEEEYYKKYIRKQAKQWEESKYIALNNISLDQEKGSDKVNFNKIVVGGTPPPPQGVPPENNFMAGTRMRFKTRKRKAKK